MFKIEVNVEGETKNHYWMNAHKDDFLQFLPMHFTREYAVEITKNDIIAYKVDESKKPIMEALASVADNNMLLDVAGTLRIEKRVAAKYTAGEIIPESAYDEAVAEVIKKFKKAKGTKPDFVGGKKPKKVKVGTGEDAVDSVEIAADDILANDVVSEELVLAGTPLVEWPYDTNGKFKGNK